jgi:hyperosmotically inducible protein
MNRAKMNRWALLALLPLCATAAVATAKNPPTEHKDARADSHQPGTDTWITTKVKADLLATENVPGMEIKVDTVNGTVMLSGTVNKQSEKDRAVAVARGIEGVKKVDADQLRVTE